MTEHGKFDHSSPTARIELVTLQLGEQGTEGCILVDMGEWGKHPADPENNPSRRGAAVGERGTVPFEAGDALLALPIASTAGVFPILSVVRRPSGQKVVTH